MEDAAFEDAEPPRGKLEALAGYGGRMPAVSRAEAAAFRVLELRHVQQPRGGQAQGHDVVQAA
jgi:hypothetical protein